VIPFHPITVAVPLAAGQKWTGGGPWVYEEKKDGVRALLSIDGCQLRNSRRPLPGPLPVALGGCGFDGELCAGTYWPFDLVMADGQDLRRRPLRERRTWLAELRPAFPAWMHPIPEGRGGEFLEAVLARGGEGIVAKHIDSRYGEPDAWVKCKDRTEDCIIAELHQVKSSARLEQLAPAGLIDCGWVCLYGLRLAGLQVGDVVEVACHHLRHASGRLREARILRARTDKLASECLAAV
jgi:hypothetical protein